MSTGRPILEEDRVKILALHKKENLSAVAIAKRFGLHKVTVQGIIRKEESDEKER